jgi:hypothetical protein
MRRAGWETAFRLAAEHEDLRAGWIALQDMAAHELSQQQLDPETAGLTPFSSAILSWQVLRLRRQWVAPKALFEIIVGIGQARNFRLFEIGRRKGIADLDGIWRQQQSERARKRKLRPLSEVGERQQRRRKKQSRA